MRPEAGNSRFHCVAMTPVLLVTTPLDYEHIIAFAHKKSAN